ncbi:ATP-binding protein [Halanaerobiaceae bacterium Z-7014]|uniref:ATP-binding protein n=1 Tax=Halonatronomonas betaini TaxID=2778430 RepID=A0A931ARR5_9FIRM|nr:ATP-binding protein [Halonatronomonas betaini]MBF8437282.1 ATP-binding protein [Halonatronomonas betaini]
MSKQINDKFKELDQLTVFHSINNDKIIQKLKSPTGQDGGQTINALIEHSENNCLSGDLWQNYLKDLIITDENIFTLSCEKYMISEDNSLYQAAAHDLKILKRLLSLSVIDIFKDYPGNLYSLGSNYKPVKNAGKNTYRKSLELLNSSLEEIINYLNKYFYEHGAGLLNQYRAFSWDSRDNLVPVNNPDSINFNNLIGYESQQKKLIANTANFINGQKAYNVLLYGESGTGKSSSVKAALNKFAGQGLRLIEINSDQIKELPGILDYLSQRGSYFIIFMDDLSFEEFETEYKHLKAIMEGGIEARPKNVLFYATSNRRHLIQEKWESREEIHQNDMINERLSLSERFGLTILFNSPDQEEYLEIVKGLASQKELEIDDAVLEEKALKWQMWHNGQSGRTARQFIDSL